ncbi:MAG: biopolymer transporter ExbD [Bdellovibrionaceae bacterium]|nr:biopolymer transporter ExbD [Pseudobdellovibrionaceae bacterium]
MGASGVGGGDKRNVNSDLNLVPYIDLLSTLICFLLITAVWQQIDAMSTTASDPNAASAPSTPDPNRVDFSVSLYQDRIEAAAGPQKSSFPFMGGQPDYQSLIALLQTWKQRWPDRHDVTLHSDSQAPYKNLIGLMDALAEAEFSDVGINTH